MGVFDPNTHIDQAIDGLTSLQITLVEEFVPSWEDLIPELSEDAIAFKGIIEKTKESFDLLSESDKAFKWSIIDAWLYPKVHNDPRLQHLYGCTGSYAVCQIDRIVSLIREEANAAEKNDIEELKGILARETDEVSAFSTLLEMHRERGSSDDMSVQQLSLCWWYILPYPCWKKSYPIRDAAEAAMQLASIDKEYIEYAYGVL